VVDKGAVSSHFQRVLARFDEVQVQYRADRERVVADDEKRQAELSKVREENEAKAEQVNALIAAQQSNVRPVTESSVGDNPWMTPRRADSATEESSCGFEEELAEVAEVGDTEALTRPTAPVPTEPGPVWTEPVRRESPANPRRQSWDDEDFSRMDWTNND
jgi:hypothetical protein